MNSVVFDASALLILLNKEPGYTVVNQYINQAIMSAVNVAEVITVLVNLGMPHNDATSLVAHLLTDIIPFDKEQAVTCAGLRHQTKSYGLSLGDRACLALAHMKQLSVITADKIWAELKLPIKILIAR